MKAEPNHQQALMLLQRGDPQRANALMRDAVRARPDDAHAHFLLARGYLDLRQEALALNHGSRAVEIDPAASQYRATLGRILVRVGREDAALDCADRASADAQATDLTLDQIAGIYTALGRHDTAAQVLQRAVDEGSRNPVVLFNLATALKFCGDFSRAECALEGAVAIAPDYVKARGALSAIRPATPDRNQIPDYLRLLDRTDNPTTALLICHSASKELEELGRIDEAMALLARGKDRMAAACQYDFAQDRKLFDALHRAFAKSGPAKSSKASSNADPIFVIGMPRSGTTVVDRILSHHPALTSVGESLQIPALLQQASGHRSHQLIAPSSVPALMRVPDMASLGRAYLDSLAARLPAGQRPVDKFHLNSLLVGFILRALPRARVLCVVRNPMDTIVGNYRQLFEYKTGIYRYNLSLLSIAQFYVEFRRLCDLWARCFPQNFLQVRYEELAAEPERIGARLLAFCGLDWDSRFARIEDNASPVATASAIQVRSPISTATIGRWKRYERHLAPVQRLIERSGYSD